MIPIDQALSSGYSEEDILDYLKKSIPKIGMKIAQAKNAGYQTSKILSFLSKTMEGEEYPAHFSQAQIQHAQREKANRITKQMLKTAGLGLGAGALIGKTLPSIAPKISQSIGKALGLGKAAETATEPVSEAMGAMSHEAAEGIKTALGENLVPRIESLASYNSPEAIPGILDKIISPETKQSILQKTGRPFNQAVKDYAQYFLTRAKEKPLSRESLQKQFGEGYVPEARTEVRPIEGQGQGLQPIESQEKAQAIQGPEKTQAIQPKTEIPRVKHVMLPDGEIGTISGEKQGISSIELPSGKIRTQKTEDLVEGPEDAAVKALELIKSFTPEQQRSTHHALNFYDPEERSAYFVFHTGDAYKVEDITADEYDQLSTEVRAAKTSGENPYGIWATGEGSRGAAYNQIIKGLKKPYKKLKVGYNIFQEFQKRIKEHERKQRKTKKQPV